MALGEDMDKPDTPQPSTTGAPKPGAPPKDTSKDSKKDVVGKALQNLGDSLGKAAQTRADMMPSGGQPVQGQMSPVPELNLPKYHGGIRSVPKTGPAILKKGERVLSVKEVRKLNKGRKLSGGRKCGR